MRVRFNLKTRQPLKQILMPVLNQEDRKTIGRMRRIILEEVNVKELNFVDEDNAVIKKKAKPNFKLLGPRFGKSLNSVADAIRKFDNRVIAKIEKEGSFKLNIDGSQFEITREDFEVQTENIEGWVVESLDNLTVALDTKLDEQLINEGLAREFVNRIQNLRKEMALGVHDRIMIKYSCEPELRKAINNQKKYIELETLAVELDSQNEGGLNGFQELNINGRACKIFIQKI
jgi:isoleucyl-tRNA synthetase